MSNELKTASVLAFERKLDVSDALMYSGSWDDRTADNWQPVTVREKSVRGTASHRLKSKSGKDDLLKRDMKVESPNPQVVDVANLPAGSDTLKVQFTLRVLAGVGVPSACNEAAYREKILTTVSGYIQKNGLAELAKRYAANLANGRFLWRNRIGAEQAEVQVARLQEGKATASWVFDAFSHSMLELTAPATEKESLQKVAELIEAGLMGQEHVLLQVTAFVRIGRGQEVFPSQELILDKSAGSKSKTLYDVSGVAAMHSQKIGNALRTIDTWYPEAAENGPIAVEPYGSVTTQGRAYRQPKEKTDFYNLLDSWVLKDKEPDVEQQHFVIATLIRGGVFGEAG